MPRKSPTKSQSSKVKIATSGDATVGGDIVGRDKIIQQIVVVGQFLDFAQVQGLLPRQTELTDYKSIAEAFEKNFGDRIASDLQQATAFAGEILKSILLRWSLSEIPKPLPFKDILQIIPPEVCRQLQARGYWETYALSREQRGDFLPLKSLSELWTRHKKSNWKFGIWKPHRGPCEFAKWQRERVTEGILPEYQREIWDIPATTSDDFRLFMAGLVIDLIRLESTASNDILFWNGLIDLLSSGQQAKDSGQQPDG